jgi:hypothetical protein
VFNQHYGHRALLLNITPKDLEIIYRSQILENDFDMEYCIDTLATPLEVYVPLDISYDIYKEYAQNCLDLLKENSKRIIYKRHDMELQNELT